MADLNMRRWRARVLWAKGLWVLGGFRVSVGGRLDKTGAVAGRCPGDEAVGKLRSQGLCEPALEPRRKGKGVWKKSQDFKRASEKVTLVEMCSHLATERA